MIHFSCKEIESLKSVSQQDNTFKPRGLWYSTDNSWIEFYKKNINRIYECQYMYKLKLHYTFFKNPDPNKVLKITNTKMFDEFTLKYGIVTQHKYIPFIYFIDIDWEQAEKEYGGIEVVPLIQNRIKVQDTKVIKKYNKKFKFVKRGIKEKNAQIYFWQYVFDIPSGCVWNPKAVSKFVRAFKI
jgi:hypothetical protein